MTLNEFFPPLLKNNLEMLKMTVADLSDADLLVRPVTGANHANWQIGHLLKAEHSLMSGCKLVMPELPAGFADRYIKQAAALDDASSFATKAELLELFTKVRAASAEHAAKLPADRWTEKGPASFTPTVATTFEALISHLSMHVGQLQVIRRKLGRPILF